MPTDIMQPSPAGAEVPGAGAAEMPGATAAVPSASAADVAKSIAGQVSRKVDSTGAGQIGFGASGVTGREMAAAEPHAKFGIV